MLSTVTVFGTGAPSTAAPPTSLFRSSTMRAGGPALRLTTAGLRPRAAHARARVLIHVLRRGWQLRRPTERLARGPRRGTASARNVDFVRKLGADDAIDYGATPFEGCSSPSLDSHRRSGRPVARQQDCSSS
jgi:hypothetical protein